MQAGVHSIPYTMTSYDPLDLHGQDEHKADNEIRARLVRETEEADLKWLMSSKRGRRIVWRLLSQSGVFQPVFHPTAMVMAYQEGKRNYGLQMLADVNKYCSDYYTTMMRENTNGRDDASRNHQ